MFRFVGYIFEFNWVLTFYGVISLIAARNRPHSAHLCMGIPFTALGFLSICIAVIMGVAYPYSSCGLEAMQGSVHALTGILSVVAVLVYVALFFKCWKAAEANSKDS